MPALTRPQKITFAEMRAVFQVAKAKHLRTMVWRFSFDLSASLFLEGFVVDIKREDR